MTALSLLPITDGDLPFVHTMLCQAVFWRDGSDTPPIDEVLAQPGLAVYVEGWGRPGDAGLIVRVADEPAGAVWVRRYREDHHGYGYLDERTPELSIAVTEEHRGRGIGRCLMTAMLADLRIREVGRVSLSVEDDNPARALYESVGFVPQETAEDATTMLRTLT